VSPRRLTATELIDLTLDPGEFASWDSPVAQPHLGSAYADDLRLAAERSGVDEAVVTGQGRLEGRPVAVIVGEFGFLGGSIGVASARRIVAALERATREGLPILAAPVSGGTRMQEGVVAFLQMAAITQAITAHKAAGLLYLVYLRHPTTGGVFASWGSLGHITVSEPDALVGFLGPKVYRALHGVDFPPGVQTGENLYAHGILDAVLPPRQLRGVAARVLDVVTAREAGAPPPAAPFVPGTRPAWESVVVSRRPGRPGVRTLLRFAAHDVTWLNGTGSGGAEPASRIALARFGGRGVVVAALDRHAQAHDEPLGPDALRQTSRGMRLAAELGLPLVTVVDTPGASLSREAEEGGLGGAIARSLAAILSLPVPTVAVLMGQGTGGGALALVPADRVIAAEHAWLGPLPPEGASVIRFGDVDHAPQLADEQGIGSADLLAAGIVDEIVPESPDAAEEPEAFCRRLGNAIERQLGVVSALEPQQRVTQRHARYAAR